MFSNEEIEHAIEFESNYRAWNEARIDEACQEQKILYRERRTAGAVKPADITLWQWENLLDRFLAPEYKTIDEAFERVKVMIRCHCSIKPPVPCPVHPAGRPQ